MTVGSIPGEPPFWKGDTVRIVGNKDVDLGHPAGPNIGIIVSGASQYLGIPGIFEYEVSGLPHGSWTTTVQSDQLVLLARGNHFRYFYTAEPPQFANSQEEANFWYDIGLLQEAHNPRTGTSIWTVQEALAGIEAGIADVFFLAQHSLQSPSNPSLSGFKFVDHPAVATAGPRFRAESRAELTQLLRRLT